jgi:hypothetical protein
VLAELGLVARDERVADLFEQAARIVVERHGRATRRESTALIYFWQSGVKQNAVYDERRKANPKNAIKDQSVKIRHK